jgi:hypothetical protein
MDFKKLADRAKQTVDKRGGTESLKEDAAWTHRVRQGKPKDKGMDAAKAIKEPGAGSRAADKEGPAPDKSPPA